MPKTGALWKLSYIPESESLSLFITHVCRYAAIQPIDPKYMKANPKSNERLELDNASMLCRSQIQMCRLKRVGNKSRVANDPRDLRLALQSPQATVAIGEGSIVVLATNDSDCPSIVVEDPAPQSLIREKLASDELDGLIWAARADRRQDFANGGIDKGSGASKLNSLVLEDDTDLEGGRIDLDEGRVADDLADVDARGVLESPLTTIGVGEGDVDIGAASGDQWEAISVERLAAEVLIGGPVVTTRMLMVVKGPLAPLGGRVWRCCTS